MNRIEQWADAVKRKSELVNLTNNAFEELGQALEKLGDIENAKVAYEMANSLKPQEFHKAKQSLDNIIKLEFFQQRYWF